MERPLEIRYGALAPSIKEQLDIQGFILGDADLERLEKQRHALNVVRICDLIPDGQVTKGFDKLHKKVIKAIQEAIKS